MEKGCKCKEGKSRGKCEHCMKEKSEGGCKSRSKKK
jgi:hypothetical protein